MKNINSNRITELRNNNRKIDPTYIVRVIFLNG